jgi:hypothetical protein
MILIEPSTEIQSDVSFIAREIYTGTATATFTDKTTKESFAYTVTIATATNGYKSYFTPIGAIMDDVVHGHTYTLVVTYDDRGTDVELFRGLCLCTNQTDGGQSVYDPNSGEFTERTTTNDYIILD